MTTTTEHPPLETSRPTHEPSRAHKNHRDFIGTLVAAVPFSFLWAAVLNALLDLMTDDWDFVRLVGFHIYTKPILFGLSTAVVWVIFLLVVCVTGRLWLTAALTLVVTLTLGFANMEKLRLRREPLYPSDFDFVGETGFLSQMIGWQAVAIRMLVLVAVVVSLLLIGRQVARVFPPIRRGLSSRGRRRLTVVRLCGVVLTVLALGYLAHFNSDGNKIRAAFEGPAGAHWAFWYQDLNYRQNGFVAGMLYNLDVVAMETPAGYSQSTLESIAAKYSAEAADLNQNRTATPIDDLNVVLVLSEAFSDPTVIEGATVDDDPIPFTRDLMDNTTSGQMLTQLIGGGTANMEFEALTGQSLSQFAPQMNTPYQMLVPKYSTYPSAVGYFRERGHKAIAIHPYMTSMYKREQVYSTLGIQDFIHDSTMASADKIQDNPFISDESAFQEVEKQIDATAEPLLVNLVTMQNHYPMADLYDDPWPVSGVSGDTKDELAGYARGINHTDKALQDFLSSLQASDEKTAVIFYGDHQPAFWSDDIIAKNDDTTMHETPFFIWTNFKDLPRRDMGITSPIYFMPTLFDALGAELPPYYALLQRLHAEIPAMEQGVYYNADGEPLSEDDLSAEAQALLHDYELVQYDMSIGERYAQDMFYPAP